MDGKRSFWVLFKAVMCKLRVVRGREKLKLLLKIVLRPFGFKRKLFLGGYFKEESRQQLEQDMQLYEELQKARFDDRQKQENVPSKEKTTVKMLSGEAEAALKKQLQESGSYVALAANSLDKGGLEAVVRMLALGMLKKNIPVRVFCIQSGGTIARQLQKQGVEVVVFHNKKDALQEYCEKHKPLLVNTHFVSDYLDVFQTMNIPVVEVIHNMYVFLDNEGWLKEARKLPYISHYIAVSESARRIFENHFPSTEGKITVVGNAFEGSQKPAVSRQEMRERLGISKEAFVYIAVGSIDARKNQVGMLRAWDIVRKLTGEQSVFLIVGSGMDHEYEYSIRKLVKERELEESVIFTGQSDEVISLLQAADVFLMDSYYEGWSVAATEALFSGLPVIHSDCGSGSELVAEGRNGVLVPNPLLEIEKYDNMDLYDAMHAGKNENMASFAGAMLAMWEEREYWKTQKSSIAQYAADTFSFERMLGRYIEVYHSIWLKNSNDFNQLQK